MTVLSGFSADVAESQTRCLGRSGIDKTRVDTLLILADCGFVIKVDVNAESGGAAPTCVPCRFLLRWGWAPGGHDGFMSFGR